MTGAACPALAGPSAPDCRGLVLAFILGSFRVLPPGLSWRIGRGASLCRSNVERSMFSLRLSRAIRKTQRPNVRLVFADLVDRQEGGRFRAWPSTRRGLNTCR